MNTVKRTYELPTNLYERIKVIARQERRSIAAQVVVFLMQAIETYERQHPTT